MYISSEELDKEVLKALQFIGEYVKEIRKDINFLGSGFFDKHNPLTYQEESSSIERISTRDINRFKFTPEFVTIKEYLYALKSALQDTKDSISSHGHFTKVVTNYFIKFLEALSRNIHLADGVEKSAAKDLLYHYTQKIAEDFYPKIHERITALNSVYYELVFNAKISDFKKSLAYLESEEVKEFSKISDLHNREVNYLIKEAKDVLSLFSETQDVKVYTSDALMDFNLTVADSSFQELELSPGQKYQVINVSRLNKIIENFAKAVNTVDSIFKEYIAENEGDLDEKNKVLIADFCQKIKGFSVFQNIEYVSHINPVKVAAVIKESEEQSLQLKEDAKTMRSLIEELGSLSDKKKEIRENEDDIADLTDAVKKSRARREERAKKLKKAQSELLPQKEVAPVASEEDFQAKRKLPKTPKKTLQSGATESQDESLKSPTEAKPQTKEKYSTPTSSEQQVQRQKTPSPSPENPKQSDRNPYRKEVLYDGPETWL